MLPPCAGACQRRRRARSSRRCPRMRSILLVDFGTSELSYMVGPELNRRFSADVLHARAPMPRVRVRGTQLAAEDLLYDVTRQRILRGATLALGFTDQDLYVPRMNFVFGLASCDARSAVVSAFRLGPHESEILRVRLLKEAVHELGHLHGLGHCADPLCVMYFSNCLADTDRKSPDFCGRCSPMIADRT